jgi:serine/threonine-protein kinase
MAAFVGERRFSFSADGRTLVYVVRDRATNRIAVRNLDELEPRILPGSDGVATVALSPNGQQLAMVTTASQIAKMNIDGSGMQTILDGATAGAGGIAWLNDDEVIYSTRADSGVGLYRLSVSTGTRMPLTRVDARMGGRFHLSPVVSPDGNLVFFTSTQTAATELHLAVHRLSDGRTVTFPEIRSAMVLGLIGNQLITVRSDGAVLALPFDARTLTFGQPVQVESGVPVRLWAAQAHLSHTGSLLYESGGNTARLVFLPPDGRERPAIDSLLPMMYPRLSPDGRQVAYRLTSANGTAIYVTDLTSGAQQRVTDVAVSDRPEWSADGRFIYFVSVVEGRSVIQRAAVDRSVPVQTVHEDEFQIREVVPMPDGSGLLYRVDAVETNRDVYFVPLDGSKQKRPVLVAKDDEKQARPSPDSKWLAYVSDESGRPQVYLRPMAEGSGRVPVSVGEALEPLWSRDGRRLFYREGDRILEATLSLGASPSVLSRRTVATGEFVGDIYHANYDVHPDGRGLLLLRASSDERRLVLVHNWGAELARRLSAPR